MKEYKIKINGNEYDIVINGVRDSVDDVTVNGVGYNVEIENNAMPAPPAGYSANGSAGSEITYGSGAVSGSGGTPAGKADAAGTEKSVKSPLPGVIIEFSVKEGDQVRRGQKVAVLEAMKMENDILAPQDGTIRKVCVSKGDPVQEGAEILRIA